MPVASERFRAESTRRKRATRPPGRRRSRVGRQPRVSGRLSAEMAAAPSPESADPLSAGPVLTGATATSSADSRIPSESSAGRVSSFNESYAAGWRIAVASRLETDVATESSPNRAERSETLKCWPLQHVLQQPVVDDQQRGQPEDHENDERFEALNSSLTGSAMRPCSISACNGNQEVRKPRQLSSRPGNASQQPVSGRAWRPECRTESRPSCPERLRRRESKPLECEHARTARTNGRSQSASGAERCGPGFGL